MPTTNQRRLFLRKTVLAATGISLLSQTELLGLNNSSVPFEGYNPYQPNVSSDLRKNVWGDFITVQGTIYDKKGSTPLPNAQVEVWHLSKSSGKFRHRTKLTTDASGNYKFLTDIPDRTEGKHPRIYFKVTSSKGTSFAELLIGKSGPYITSQHWEQHCQLGNKLFPTSTALFNNTLINFNISNH